MLRVAPAADAYVRDDSPSSNFGGGPTLQVDTSPAAKNFLIKFAVSGTAGRTVASAKLRLHAVDSSDFGGEFRSASNNWSEGSVTWQSAPPAGLVTIAALGRVTFGTWYEVDVTPLVAGGDVTFTLRASSTSTDGADYSSKEGGFAPELVITLNP